jgi:hypothetical protein
MRSVIPLLFIIFPARINPGMLNKTKTSIPEYIFKGMITSGVPEKIKYTNDARPKEKAMGTPNSNAMKKTANRIQIIS